MTRVKIFTSRSTDDLEDMIDEYINNEINQVDEIVDIKLSTVYDNQEVGSVLFTAMVIFE